MKKSNYVALVGSVLGTLLFGIGMCMCLLTEWQLESTGVCLGIVGLLAYLITFLIYRRLTNKAPIVISFKGIILCFWMLVTILVFGYGLVLTLENQNIPLGILIGCIGILLFIGLIPFITKMKRA